MSDPTRTDASPPSVPGPPAETTADAKSSAPAPPPELPGFDVLGELGRGGMGVVYQARQVRLNREVALKMLPAADAEARDLVRFFAEAEAVAAVRHPHVVQVHEFGQHAGRPFLVMEYLPGGSLADRLAAGRLDPRAAAVLVGQLAGAVQAAHDLGIVHRDLKPANVLFDAGGGPKVVDFGLAKWGGGADLTKTGVVMGTPSYMAPEQARGETKFVGPAADVWALGVILYEALTGVKPFPGADGWSILRRVLADDPIPPRRIAPAVPRDLERVCLKCLEKAVPDRYPTAAALADDLGRFLAGETVSVRSAGVVERAARWARRKPTAAAAYALTGLAVVLAVGVGGALWLWQQADDARAALAEQNARTTTALRREEEATRRLTRSRAAGTLEQAIRRCEDGDVRLGLVGLGRALEQARDAGDPDLERAIRVNLAAWSDRLVELGPGFDLTGDVATLAVSSADGRVAAGGAGRTLTVTGPGGDGPARSFTVRPTDLVRALGDNLLPSHWAAAFTRDGARVLTAGSDGRVWLWDVGTGQSAGFWDAAPGGADVWAVAVGPDGTVWTGGQNGRVCQWDLPPAGGKPRRELTVPGDPDTVRAVLPHPDGKRLFAASRNSGVWAWDLADPRTPRQVGRHGWHWVNDLSLSPDGRFLASAGSDGAVRVWDLDDGVMAWEHTLVGATRNTVAFAPARVGADGDPEAVRPNRFAFLPVGALLAAGDSEGGVRLFHFPSGTQVAEWVFPRGAAHRLRFTPDGARLAVAGVTRVQAYRTPRPPFATLPLSTYRSVYDLACGPAGRVVVTTGVSVHDVARTGDRPPRSIAVEDTEVRDVRTLAALPDGRVVRGGKRVLDVTADPAGPLPPPQLRFATPIDRVAAAAGVVVARQESQFWRVDPADGSPTRLAVPEQRWDGFDLRPDGRELTAWVGADLYRFDADTGRPTGPPVTAPGLVLDARYLPPGDRLVVGLRSDAAQVLTVSGDRPTFRRLPGSLADARAVAVGPDGRTVLVGRSDGTAQFVDPATGFPVGPRVRTTGGVTRVAFTPDGAWGMIGTSLGQVTLWPAPTAEAGGDLPAVWAAIRARTGLGPEAAADR